MVVELALLKGVEYLRLRLVRVVEKSIDFFQNFLVILRHFFEVHKILNQRADPPPGVLVGFRFTAIDVLNQLEDAVAEFLFFVRFFDVLEKFRERLTPNYLQYFIHSDHIVFI